MNLSVIATADSNKTEYNEGIVTFKTRNYTVITYRPTEHVASPKL